MGEYEDLIVLCEEAIDEYEKSKNKEVLLNALHEIRAKLINKND